MFKFKKKLDEEYDEFSETEETVDDETEQDEEAPAGPQRKQYPINDVQSLVPVKEIYRGMIVTADDRYVRIMEVLPINFSLRSAEEQDNIIHLFSSWLKVAPKKIQFKVVTRKADSFNIVNNVLAAAEKETNENCKELTQNYIQFIKDVSGQEALSRRFFVIYEYEPSSSRQRTIDEIADEMEELSRKIKAGLESCGNEVIVPQEEDYFQAEALYTFYNRRSCAIEQFSERIIRVTEDYMVSQGLTPGEDAAPEVPVVNYIAPRGMDFTQRDFFICDGQYFSILMITKGGYPVAVPGGWMSTLIETGDGVDVDILLVRKNRSEVRDKVSMKLKMTRIKAYSRNDTDTDFEEIEDAIQSAQYIKQSLANGEDFYELCTYITVSADTYEDLGKRVEAVTDYLHSTDIETKLIQYRLEDAFLTTAPLLFHKQDLAQFAARNVMTSGAASLYPFTSCELCDENGIVLGVNRRYSSLVNLDIFSTKKYKNANLFIAGTSGMGKTFAEQLIAMRMRMQGIQTFIIVPDKAHEFQRACNHIGGSFIRIGPGARSCINIMDIRPVVSPIAEYLEEVDSLEADSWLAQKASQLLTFFHILIPDLTNEEEQLIDEAIIHTYSNFNITHDNRSVYVPGTKQLRPMPIIGDLYVTLKSQPETRRIANILGRFVTGSASSFNRQTNVDLNNKYIVFDISELQGSMKAVAMFSVMDFLWSKIKENRTEKKAILIDEGWQLIGASSDSRAAEFVYRIFKTIRGYGGSAIFATQDISDLFAFQDGKYGKAIISNSKIKIILGLEPQEAKCVQDVLQLTKNEIRSIVNFDRGEALICANSNRLPVYIKPSYLEQALITTDREELEALIKQRRAQQEMERLAANFADASERQPTAPEPAQPAASPEEEPEIAEQEIVRGEEAVLENPQQWPEETAPLQQEQAPYLTREAKELQWRTEQERAVTATPVLDIPGLDNGEADDYDDVTVVKPEEYAGEYEPYPGTEEGQSQPYNFDSIDIDLAEAEDYPAGQNDFRQRGDSHVIEF